MWYNYSLELKTLYIICKTSQFGWIDTEINQWLLSKWFFVCIVTTKLYIKQQRHNWRYMFSNIPLYIRCWTMRNNWSEFTVFTEHVVYADEIETVSGEIHTGCSVYYCWLQRLHYYVLEASHKLFLMRWWVLYNFSVRIGYYTKTEWEQCVALFCVLVSWWESYNIWSYYFFVGVKGCGLFYFAW